MIAGAHMLISPDTATIHLAAAAGVPCTVLLPNSSRWQNGIHTVLNSEVSLVQIRQR
ncbi:MAG: hypothetical protein IPM83_09425 [Ignavibacteria bacterium]|nr:hypothetical protein [Ignavibacteria bacterium]